MLTRVLQEAVFFIEAISENLGRKIFVCSYSRFGLVEVFPDVQNPVFWAHFQS